jgi:drug/metabolite transporter (DMT)-like permease
VLNRIDLILLAFLTLFWGINWPITKYAVIDFPPLTFRLLSISLGIVAIGIFMVIRKDSFVVPVSERLRVIKLGFSNMVVWHMLTILAIKHLSSGRTAIIAYTMPVWALLASMLLFKDKITWRGGLGVFLALMATGLLTVDEFSSLIGHPLGIGLVLIAAISWGIGTAMMRHLKVEISNASLTFWMMIMTFLILLGFAAAIESSQWRLPRPTEWAAILFNGFIVFGFCHIVWFRIARKLPPVASSLSIMLIPILGVFSGAWALNETIGPYDIGALILILLSMSAVLLRKRS